MLYAQPPIIMGPTAPVATEAPCARLTDTIDVLKIAGNPEKAPANIPKPLELSQLLTKMQHMHARPRIKCVATLTLFFPLGVGGRDQQRMIPTNTQINMMHIEYTQSGIPNWLVYDSNQVTIKAATNHATNDTNKVSQVTATLLYRLLIFIGRIFHIGKKIRFVAKIPM